MIMAPLARSVQVHKAVGHPARLRILFMLRDGPLCGCQMSAILKLAASTVSQHLSELRQAGLVSERKDGRWVEYSLAEDPSARRTLEAIAPDLDKDPVIRADQILVRALRRVPLEELCQVDLDLARLDRPAVDAAIRRSKEMVESASR